MLEEGGKKRDDGGAQQGGKGRNTRRRGAAWKRISRPVISSLHAQRQGTHPKKKSETNPQVGLRGGSHKEKMDADMKS